MIDRRVFFVVMMMVLTGCSKGAELVLPEAPIPKAWPGGEVLTDAQAPVHPVPWRQFCADPMLREVVEAALESNRDLRIAVARMEKAAAELGVAAANRLPSLQGGVSHHVTRTPADLSTSGKSALARREEVGFFLPAFELDFWGRLARLEEGARSAWLASAETTLAARIVLIAQVMEGFVVWREMAARLALAEATLDIRQEARNFAEQRLGAGVVAAQTELRSAMALEEVRAEVAEWRRQESLAYNALRLLTGKDWDARREWPPLEGLDLTLKLELALPAQVLEARPDVRAAEHRLRAAHANVAAARAAFWPRIFLTTAVGTASQALSGLFANGSAAWSFVPRLDVPIFELAARKSQLASVEAERGALLAEYEKVVQQAFREVADGLTSREALWDRMRALLVNRDAQRKRLALIKERYQAGLEGREAFLSARQELYATQQLVYGAQRQLLVNQIALFKALGGGVE
ncbi:MAG: efflux transporter outer membrane subunit [Magnetococcales bacterium]|nr:efflux transporter outer membrane subunit [Magnetococcales bacterium]